MKIAGSRVNDGEIDCFNKYRILRNDQCIIEGLEIHSLKLFKQDVKKVELGSECGIALKGLKGGITLQKDDILECYREKIAEPERFNSKAGLQSSYWSNPRLFKGWLCNQNGCELGS